MNVYHVPVLAEEAVGMLDIKKDGIYADLTFGGGGHSRLILSHLDGGGRLFGFDQDADAQANIPDDPRFTFVEGNFRFLRGQLRRHGVEQVDGILADLGVSSHHFDTGERGFSFRYDAPLDMRMNQKGTISAMQVINGYPVEKLTRIFREYGDIERPHKVSGCIARRRETAPIETIGELIEAVGPCTPKPNGNKFLSKLFQSVRIEVNREVEALKMALEQSLKVLKPGGRLVVISYHSVEDRLVKNFLRDGTFSEDTSIDLYGRRESPWKVITRKAVVPSDKETEENPRSRSAKMRAAEKR